MKVVIDLGCAERNGADSVAVLVEEYKPDYLFGFDPALPELVADYVGDTWCNLIPKAAWVAAGEISFKEDGSASRIGSGPMVEAFDFSEWLGGLPKADEVIVKMDIEGAEIPVLQKMVADGTDLLVDELLVEWHGEEVEVGCPVREWWL